MGDPRGFMKVKRQSSQYRRVCERIKDYKHVDIMKADEESSQQASRCMDCGIPFCHWGCSVGNLIPEWNDAVFSEKWEKAFKLLDATNNLPEITGRVCPAQCEYSCVLGINNEPVTIRENELAIIEHAFKHGLIKPRPPLKRTGKKTAVIGSGPAGLACAAQLNRAGHDVVVYEKDDKVGGLMRYGIPDFKLEKHIIERRVALMEKEGIVFKPSVEVGKDLPAAKLLKDNDAVCLAGGSRVSRDIDIEGRDLKGIHFAMDYLTQSNRRASGENIPEKDLIDANGKKVIVIGGGDTGSDCVGTAHRQGASCVVQIEIMPKPLECRTEDYPWPMYPLLLKSSSSHKEGGERHWSVLTKKFKGEDGHVKQLECARVEFKSEGGNTCPVMTDVPGSSFDIDADLVVLAVGFLRPEHKGLLSDLGVEFDERGNVKTGEDHMTSVNKVFSAGDMHSGQSIIVRAISEGRKAAHHMDKYLTGHSSLPEW